MQHLPLLILAPLLACVPPALSRHPAPATETLDVAASLSRAHAAVSTNTLPLHYSLTATDVVHHTDTTTTTGRLTLRLHSRDFLLSQQGRHPTYKSLVLARLRRDSAVSARAALAADGLKSADLLPSNTEPLFAASAADIQGPVVSGVGQGSGEYFSRVGVGRPARQLYMVLDTGSDITWLQCQPCADCYAQSNPVYDPSLSASYAAVGCDSPRCRDLDAAACRNATGACLYKVAYGDGSYTVGDFAIETLTLGDSAPVSVGGQTLAIPPSFGGQTLAIPSTAFAMDDAGSGGVIVDFGTAVTRLQSAAYSVLRVAFVQSTQSLLRTSGVSLFDTCYDLSGRTSVQVPTMSLRFEGDGEMKLPAKNYLIPVDGSGTYCLAFAATSGVSIIGNMQQQGVRVSFDIANLTAVDALR